MKRRLALILAVACAIVLQISVAQVAAQETGQTVKAAIPPQAVGVPPQARPPAIAPPPARPEVGQLRPEAANVRIEVTISYQVGNGAPLRRTAVLTVADQGQGSLRAGNQVAVPSTTFTPVAATAKGDSAGSPPTPATPMTSFNYRSVGLNVDARNVYIQENKAKMSLSVEFSTIDEKTSDAGGRPPSFPTFSQNLSLILENGKPLVVAQSSDYLDNVERKQSVEVKATILR